MTIHDYEQQIERAVCRWCSTKLPSVIQMYPHSDGWTIEGMSERQWLYVHCVKCEYDWSLWKLGVPRDKGGSG